jgi:NAD+ synthase (glutamine-hydrolysing)
MYDGRSDVEVFGTSYDFVELFLELKRRNQTMNYLLRDGWCEPAQEQFDALSARLERLHNFNGHKYLGASPAVHLDVRAARIPGGWKYETWTPKEGV